jgi:HEAT repeat protein
MGSRRALFIAPLYDGQFVSHLPGAPLVEQRLAKALTDNGGYDFRGIRGTVTRPNFRKAIAELVDTTSEVLFYFYGHGVVRDGMTGLFVTSDGAPYDEGVSMNEILQAGFSSKAREAVFILDCCHAGAAMGVDGEVLGSIAGKMPAGRVLIAGCASHQQGWVGDQEGKKLGVFSWYALLGLEGKARLPRSPDVRGSSLGTYITDKFRSWNQTPVFLIRETGDQSCIITSGFCAEGDGEQPTTNAESGEKKASVLGIPFMPSQIFVGRNAELDTLRRTLIDGDHAIAVSATVEGLGGIGKTEIVIQLLRDKEIEKAFATIVWLDAAGPLGPQWEKIGESLDLNVASLDQKALVQRVSRRLNELGRTLIVLDNASEWRPEDRLIPLDISLLVTTRTRGFGGTSFRHLELDILSEEAARKFLVMMVPRLSDDPGLPRLLEELDGHALALEIAAGTINALGLSTSDYLTRVENHKPSPTDVLSQIKHGRTVEECLAITWTSLKRDSSRALWRRASLFAPTSAHRDLLRVSFEGDVQSQAQMRYVQSERSGELQDAFYPGDFDEAYAELRIRNVFSRTEGVSGDRWAIHRLVRDFGRRRAAPQEFLAHTMALSEWLRAPTLSLQQELPHVIATLLDSSRFGSEFRLLLGGRDVYRESLHRSGPAMFDNDYIIDFIRSELRDPRAITMLLDGLTDLNEDVRKQAIRLLENLSHVPEVLEGVAAALDDPDPAVRALAGRAIYEHGTTHVIAILANTLESSKNRAKVEALRCLAKLGSEAIPVMEKALADQVDDIRVEAALALADQRVAAGAEVLVHAAEVSEDTQIRVRALSALGKFQDAQWLTVCFKYLDNASSAIREAALNAFESCEDVPLRQQALARFWSTNEQRLNRVESFLPDLRQALYLSLKSEVAIPTKLAGSLLKSSDWKIRQLSAQVLAFCPTPDAKKFLKSALKDYDSDVREAAINSLAALRDLSCHDRLLTMSKKDTAENVRKAAVKAIKAFGILSSNSDKIEGTIANRVACVVGLRLKKNEASVPLLLQSITDKSPEVRREVARALGTIGSLTARERLLEAAKTDADEQVRALSAAALLRLRCKNGGEGEEGCRTARLIEEESLVAPEELIAALSAEDDDLKICAAMLRAIRKSLGMGYAQRNAAKYTDFLKRSLDEQHWEDRLYGILGLASANNKDARDSIVKLLDDPHADVRREAARALGLVGDGRARSKLTEIVDKDPDPLVREQACSALSSIGAR